VKLAAAGNTVVPALLALEELGFAVTVNPGPEGSRCSAKRGSDEYVADDPVTVLGLVKLAEMKGSGWRASDQDVDNTLRKYGLG
jgi:hypothetical protein